jgi:CrcB protein
MPSWGSIAAVGGGAAVGAWMRWGLSVALNPLLPMLPLGTLASNLLGGLLMGFAMAIASRYALLAPEIQLLVTTGFLGGLTTFSTFSAEVASLVVRREWIWSATVILVHVVGSVGLTLLGLLIARSLFQAMSS